MNPQITQLVQPSGSSDRYILTFDIINLAPRSTRSIPKRPGVDFLPQYFRCSLHASNPELRSFQVGVGGSRRRGRRASLMWAAETLIPLRRDPDVWIDMASIGRNLFVAPLSISSVAAHGPFVFPICKGTADITLAVVNREPHRRVNGSISIVGTRVR